jgi:hypothetical protein
MKRILSIVVIVFCLLSCEKSRENDKEIIVACGINDPKENIVWLADLIKKQKMIKVEITLVLYG